MEYTETILEIQEKYDKASWENILCNFKIALQIGEEYGIAVDRGVTLSNVTNRSRHTVNSWFNRKKKIPLIDICMVAKYLGMSIYPFIVDRNLDGKKEFTSLNVETVFSGAIARDVYIRAVEMQHNTDKDIVLNNIREYFEKGYGDVCMEICGCKKDTYYAWFNRSRKNVKIPLLSLCKIAEYLNVNVFTLMEV